LSGICTSDCESFFAQNETLKPTLNSHQVGRMLGVLPNTVKPPLRGMNITKTLHFQGKM